VKGAKKHVLSAAGRAAIAKAAKNRWAKVKKQAKKAAKSVGFSSITDTVPNLVIRLRETALWVWSFPRV
jgi:hypothetical protein